MFPNPDDYEPRGALGRWYRKDRRDKHPYEWKSCVGCGVHGLIRPGCQFCCKSCANRARTDYQDRAGTDSPNWKGDDAGYKAKHYRIYAERGLAKDQECIFGCAGPSRIEWAHHLGPGEVGAPDEYFPACALCHRSFDNEVRLMSA